MQDRTPLLERLHQLESQVDQLKKRLDSPKQSGYIIQSASRLRWQRFGRGVRRSRTWLLANWGLLGFLFAVFVTVWVYLRYDIGYFEPQETLSLSYVKLGDQLMLNGEFTAAREAYSAAIQLNQSNAEARRGLLKTDILQPLSGQRFTIPEVENAKLSHLIGLMKPDEGNGVENETYIVSYFRGVQYERQHDYPCAKHFYLESVTRNPNFIYGYISLGYASILAGDPADAPIKTLEGAPGYEKSALALNNLGYCYMLQTCFKTAIDRFQKSLSISPYLEAHINLGDAYRYLGEVDKALRSHNDALEWVEDARNEKENPVAGPLAINFMPVSGGDNKTTRNYVTIDNLNKKRMLVYYELSFDYALKSDFVSADRAFEQAYALDRDGRYHAFFDNKIESIKQISEAKPSMRSGSWFEIKQQRFHNTQVQPTPEIQSKCE